MGSERGQDVHIDVTALSLNSSPCSSFNNAKVVHFSPFWTEAATKMCWLQKAVKLPFVCVLELHTLFPLQLSAVNAKLSFSPITSSNSVTRISGSINQLAS